MTESKLLSHAAKPQILTQIIEEKIARITQAGDKPYASVQQQLAYLDELTQFDLGRFLLQNRGVNGYWTHYILTYPWQKNHTTKTKLENFILEKSPLMLATQERFRIFLNENQKSVANDKHLASIPCGLMGELFYLDFSPVDHIRLTGVDYDGATFADAKNLAAQTKLTKFAEFVQRDAWQLNLHNEFDLITSNGLNIYEPDDEKVVALYQQFYDALKPNGKLVVSFLTHPPGTEKNCEWRMEKINQQDLLLQKILLVDIVEVKWQCFRSTETTKSQLTSVGFKDLHFIPDKANIFPTVVAIK